MAQSRCSAAVSKHLRLEIGGFDVAEIVLNRSTPGLRLSGGQNTQARIDVEGNLSLRRGEAVLLEYGPDRAPQDPRCLVPLLELFGTSVVSAIALTHGEIVIVFSNGIELRARASSVGEGWHFLLTRPNQPPLLILHGLADSIA